MIDMAVPELAIVDDEGCIFTRGDRYEIPLYQRPYAWGEEHIEQLIEDVDGLEAEGVQRYYLGSLVVARKGEHLFEVIDGQQRLTTLYLLLSALGVDVGERTLSFSCRERSDYTLAHLGALAVYGDVEDRLIEPNIASGFRVVMDRPSSGFDGGGLTALKAKLARTCLYRIEVPERTDLNHYFEIMNTRCEQLEQHEVLKAWLMEPLGGSESARFARIWDACSDMGCYVQMRFGVEKRQALFGWGFDQFPTKRKIDSVDWGTADDEESLGIREILALDGEGPAASADEDDEPTRFESVIDFRFFLLHALKVFVHTRRIESRDGQPVVASLLDDKRLKAAFERVVRDGVWQGRSIDRAQFSNEFAECLLQARFLFDKCIIKREYAGGDLEGRWSLRELQRTSKKGHHFRNTRFKQRYRERGTTSDRTNREVLMLESCLRVSYTSPKVMHWITELLCQLMADPDLAWSHRFVGVVDRYARGVVGEWLAEGDFSQGVNTPHVVLNYLDFLLWKQSGVDDFTFEFRTSVEHWYPQNPSDDTFEHWGNVDRFGNLCLVQRNVNSKFSNLNPLAKKATFKEKIAGGSLKLRVMARLTTSGDDWRDEACKRHEEGMLHLLREACTFNGETL